MDYQKLMVLQFMDLLIHESDLIVRPDPSTYAIIPWIDKYKTCRLICDILRGGSNRIQFLRDPRGIAKKS